MPPKRKTEGDSAESSDKQVKRATTGYTSQNERAILMAMTKIALENCKRIAESPGTGGKSVSAMNMKVRGLMKNIDKTYFGGDGKWADTYKLERGGKCVGDP